MENTCFIYFYPVQHYLKNQFSLYSDIPPFKHIEVTSSESRFPLLQWVELPGCATLCLICLCTLKSRWYTYNAQAISNSIPVLNYTISLNCA